MYENTVNVLVLQEDKIENLIYFFSNNKTKLDIKRQKYSNLQVNLVMNIYILYTNLSETMVILMQFFFLSYFCKKC